MSENFKKLTYLTNKAICQYGMIENGDRVLVAVSGGKDSFALLDVLLHFKQQSKWRFELLAVNLDQKQPGFPAHVLPEYFAAHDIPYRILEQDTYSVVKEKIPVGKTMCSLCSRLRRGVLYDFAQAEGFNRLALGHHRDDIIETLFLNLFYGGKTAAMPPLLPSPEHGLSVIRPLAFVPEQLTEIHAVERQLPIIPCDLCGSQEQLKRKQIKHMLKEWELEDPQRLNTIMASICNVQPSLMADQRWYESVKG